MQKEMPRTRGATSSITGGALDEDVARVFQAFLQMANLELEGRAGENRRLKFLDMFIRLSPPEYAGNPDEPLEGVEWLQRIKKCFDVSDVPEDLRVQFATFKLTGAAYYWWEFVKKTRDLQSISWAEFEELFLNKYFPETIRQDKYIEFMELTQGNMTVAQYDSKFLQLLWHAPSFVSSDENTASKFVIGLRSSIEAKAAIMKDNTYIGTWNAALRAERATEWAQELFDRDCGGGEKRPRRQYVCHNCGQPGHIRPNCPNYQSSSSLF